MEWLSNLTNGENGSAINLVLITLALAILLIVIVWIFRKMTGTAARRAMRSRVPRLSITDSTTVDEKRYLVMVRRDNVEHLLLIGGANDVVVESNIVRAQTAQKPAANVAAEKPQTVAVEQQATEPEPSIAAPIAGAAAIGAAGLAAAASTATNAATAANEAASDMASSIGETATNATEAVADQASEITDAVTDTVSETVSDVAEVASTAVENVTETISVDTEAQIEVETPVVDTPEVATVDEVEIPEMDLESAISAKLDDALSSENLDITVDEAEVVADNSAVDPQSGNDDEMQRLLDELSGETKEPAQ